MAALPTPRESYRDPSPRPQPARLPLELAAAIACAASVAACADAAPRLAAPLIEPPAPPALELPPTVAVEAVEVVPPGPPDGHFSLRLFRNCGGNVDNATLATPHREFGMWAAHTEAGYSVGFQEAGLTVSKRADGSRCASHITIGAHSYEDLDGDGRLDARDGPDGARIAVGGQWLVVGRTMERFRTRFQREEGTQNVWEFSGGRWRPFAKSALAIGDGRRGIVNGCRPSSPEGPVGPDWTRLDGERAGDCEKLVQGEVWKTDETTRYTFPLQGESVSIESGPDRVTIGTRHATMTVDLDGNGARRVHIDFGAVEHVDSNGDGRIDETTSR